MISTTVPDDGLLAPAAAALTVALEQAAAAIARLDMALLGHPLAAAWAYRARLDAVRRQAAADGKAIDPWSLAALVGGVRLRLDSAAPVIDRGAIFAAARHALALYRWSSRPDADQREAIAGRRRDSHAAAAIDLLAAAPLLSATALAQLLGIAIKNAIRLLDGFVGQGLASEVTHSAKRRLYGLTHLAPLRAATTAPRRPQSGRRPGRPGAAVIDPVDATAAEAMGPLAHAPPLPPCERRQFDFSDIDQLLDQTDQALRRAQQVLEQHSKHSIPTE